MDIDCAAGGGGGGGGLSFFFVPREVVEEEGGTRTIWFWMVLSSAFPEPKSAKKRWECESKWRGRREVGVEIGDCGR